MIDKDIVYEPTTELLDEHLREMIQLNENYKSTYAELKKLQHEREKAINDIVNKEDKDWKKVYRYKANAEAHIDTTNPERSDKIQALYSDRKTMEADYELLKTIYYHAKRKIEHNRHLDVEASTMWGETPF